MKKTVKTNKKFKSLELKFAKKPGKDILEKLRKSAFKWAPTKKHWHAKKNPKNEAFAKSLGGSVQTKLSL